ncbi:MAG: hypothetical protein V3V00_14320 [Saprospiraceae bacterium]
MKIWIILTLAVELVVGLILISFPEIVPQLKGVEGNGLTMARMYGAAAIVMAVLCFWTLRYYALDGVIDLFLHVMIAFQFLATTAIVISYVKGENVDARPILLHSVFLVGYIYFYIKRK